MPSQLIVGVDEAGRGPLAGPVCAGAVILGADHGIVGLADSKTLSEKKRERLAPEIQEKCVAWGLGWASAQEIDTHDILRATFIAMARAVEECLRQLQESASIDRSELNSVLRNPSEQYSDLSKILVQVDGNRSPAKFDGPWHWPYATETVVKGDQKIAEISAASILAKTARDKEMRRLHDLYPQYGFAQHAGYGTVFHLQALEYHGPCPEHRTTFAPVTRCMRVTTETPHAG